MELVFPIVGTPTAEMLDRIRSRIRESGYECDADTSWFLERKFLTDDDGEEYESFPMVHFELGRQL